MGVRTEIAHTLAARTPVDHQPRKLLVEGHRKYGVGLVVSIADVESRVELLDPVVLELQCFDLGADHRPLHLRGGGDHLPGAGMQARDIGEIRRQPAAQAFGFADIDDPATGIPESVDARLQGYGSGCRAIRRGIGHGVRLVRLVSGGSGSSDRG